jgi:hypothetical protein
MLNAGHRRGAVAGRCLTRGKIIETEKLPAYCAVALAGLDDLPDTIRTRSVIIRMRRRAPNEVVEPWRHRVNGPQAEPIAEQLAAWSNSSARLIRWPDMPAGIEDRNADVWEPLLAIAELAGGEWRERARVAAVALVADMQSERQTLGIQLLADLRMIFEDQPALSTEVILVTLNGIEEAPWGALGRGKNPEDRGLDSRGLATRLRKYKTADGEDIGPRDVRIGDWRGKGYRADDLADAWSRYLPPEPHKSATSATEDELVADVPDVADKSEGGEALFDLCQLCGAELWAPQSQQRGTCERCCRTSQPSEAERPASLPLA